ncbi:MAG: DUF5036 family protein, partial [Massilibacteroides sp.]|nr:DUF5036 family protein [Massilibacteroides sp.]
GKKAVQIEAAYYKAYVVSPIVNDEVTTGAVLKYVLTYPEAKGLPEVGTIIGTLDEAGDNTEIELPKDAECYFVEHKGSEEENSFDIQFENGKLKIALLETTNRTYGPYGTYNIYIRSGDVFTVVKLNIGI